MYIYIHNNNNNNNNNNTLHSLYYYYWVGSRPDAPEKMVNDFWDFIIVYIVYTIYFFQPAAGEFFFVLFTK